MTKKELTGTTAFHAPSAAKASLAQRAIAALGTEAVKADAAQRVADSVLSRGLVGWLAAQTDEVRADIFVAIEATLSASDCHKLAINPLCPQIAEDRVEAARAETERQREEARRARQAEKDAAERARYESLRAKFEPEASAGEEPGED